MMGGSHHKPRRSAGLFVPKTRCQLRRKSPSCWVQRHFQRDVHKGEKLASISFAIRFLESICFRRQLLQTCLSPACQDALLKGIKRDRVCWQEEWRAGSKSLMWTKP